ncbi:RidA family protein [Rhodococcus erythropolis]|uniref:RidA family protein n=1 Tax=Rhodococcus erythropolis TaxID=1833 RepID=UPI0037B13E5C
MIIVNPPTVASPMGQFSHAALVPADTRTAFVSGQVGVDSEGRLSAPDCYGQTRQALANLRAIVEHLGAGPGDIVKMFTLVCGPDSFTEFARARTEVFADWFPDAKYPAHSAAIVTALAAPELCVEIEAIVAVPQ